jgi:3-oxoacyl-[acyl-carrier protein] reductase
MALPFAGKHCAIVGATGTIGFSIAKSFASRGAVLSLLGRTAVDARPKLEPLLTPYQPPPGTRADRPSAHRFIAVDARSQAGLKSAFAPEDSLEVRRAVCWTALGFELTTGMS